MLRISRISTEILSAVAGNIVCIEIPDNIQVCVKYSQGMGVCLPFREDGYGVFYSICNESLTFLISIRKTGPYTSAIDFENHLEEALTECYTLADKSKL